VREWSLPRRLGRRKIEPLETALSDAVPFCYRVGDSVSMTSEDLYLMPNAKDALLCIQGLESEHSELTGCLGVFVVLNEDEHPDWYVSVNTSCLSREGSALVVALLSSRGCKSEQSRESLTAHGSVLFRSVGGLDQIMNDLEALGESQRDLRAKIQLN
jgi:hypothetical protein